MSQGHDLPVYIRIADDLHTRIRSGEPPVGGMLPSEASLVRSYGVARGTVRQALAELENLGVLASEMGKGRRVVGETAGGRGPIAARYEAIAQSLRGQIEGGSLGQGQRLPSEEALADQFAVSKGGFPHEREHRFQAAGFRLSAVFS
ncbi:GntR family transcriptional regulator [Streptosporangium sp. NPDC049046]|uniref:GntR family transcriptional regulator n=1 Tax=Streptosporangium sp. NPDC049046 TaxID=3155031 RepID=UPI0034364DF9